MVYSPSLLLIAQRSRSGIVPAWERREHMMRTGDRSQREILGDALTEGLLGIRLRCMGGALVSWQGGPSESHKVRGPCSLVPWRVTRATVLGCPTHACVRSQHFRAVRREVPPKVLSEEVWNTPPSRSARLMEPFGASGNEVTERKCLKKMVGTRRLELLTSTVQRPLTY